MNHGLCQQIKKILSGGRPLTVAEVVAQLPAPRFWQPSQLRNNVGSLLAQYAGSKWQRVGRGRYKQIVVTHKGEDEQK